MTRETFRPIVAGEKAWQRQLRDRYAEEPGPAVDLELRTAASSGSSSVRTSPA
jgi:hypothetical protein